VKIVLLRALNKYLISYYVEYIEHTFSSCDFMMGLGKPKLNTKFEVASFSRCKNIKGEPKIFGSSPSPGPRLFLATGVIF